MNNPTQDSQSELEEKLLKDISFQHILKFAPQSQRELMTFELAKYFEAYVTTRVKNIKGIIKMSDIYTFEDGTKLYSEKALSTRVKEAQNEMIELVKAHIELNPHEVTISLMEAQRSLTTTTNGKDNSNA